MCGPCQHHLKVCSNRHPCLECCYGSQTNLSVSAFFSLVLALSFSGSLRILILVPSKKVIQILLKHLAFLLCSFLFFFFPSFYFFFLFNGLRRYSSLKFKPFSLPFEFFLWRSFGFFQSFKNLFKHGYHSEMQDFNVHLIKALNVPTRFCSHSVPYNMCVSMTLVLFTAVFHLKVLLNSLPVVLLKLEPQPVVIRLG